MVARFTPPIVPPEAAVERLCSQGYAVVSARGLASLIGRAPEAFGPLTSSWDALPPDLYLKDGGRYRYRRHSCFVIEGQRIERAPHRAHWQPLDYNALHGGMHRWFDPIAPEIVALPAFGSLLTGLGSVFRHARPAARWHAEVHQFRIDTAGGVGRPTPEGAHRDGVDFVAVVLVGRHGIKGGETRVFQTDAPAGERFTLEEPWSALLLDDTRVIHESTPIQPTGEAGYRDTLVITYRAGGFQGDD